MKEILLAFPLVILFCFASSCQRHGEEAVKNASAMADIAADVETIKKLSHEYGATVTAGDVDGFLDLFTDEAILMPPNTAMIIGKEKIRPLVQAAFGADKETGLEEITTPSEIKIFGDWAFDLGITTFKSRGKAIEDTNKYIRVWQKLANGSWKLARVIWNSNNSSPSPPKKKNSQT
jgi:uncharacterized protein (TIGR02246 family)